MLGKFFKKIKDVAADLSPFAGVAASAFGLGPLYSTLIGAGVPLLAGKGGREALAGGIGGYFGGQTFGKNTLKDVLTDEAIRKAAGERFKKAAIFESLGENNPLRNLPAVLGGTGFLYGVGAFDTDQAPSNLIEDFTYNPADNKLITSGVSDKFLEDAQQADIIGNNPGDIYEFLRKVGLLNSDGNRMTFDDGKGTVMGMTPQTLFRMPTTDERIESANRMAQLEGSEEYEAYIKRLIDEQIKRGKPKPDTFISDKAGKGNFATGGGIGDLMEPSMMGGQIGGDRVNPIGGRLVGMGAGREDLLEGEIVDPNTGKTQEILVSNNEHVIPEYTLFALGGGDTEKGQQMMDNLRAETKPMAKQMGYDFQGAEDGSMNYAPLMAQDGTDTKGEGLMTVTKELSDFIRGSNRLLSEEESMKQSGAIVQRFGPDKVREMIMAARLREMEMNKQKGMITRSPGVEVFDLPTMGAQDGRQTAMPGPGMNLQEIIKKMMAQGKSIEEIMAIMSKLNMGMPKQRPPMALAQDGMGTEEINGLKKRGLQEGDGTEFLKAGLGKMVRDLDQANQIARQI